MAVAYAGLVSLLNTMDQIKNHPRLSTTFNNYQFESLFEKLDFFLDFVENYSDADNTEAEELVRRIAVVARDAEYIIEAEAADRIRAALTQQSPGFLSDLQMIIQDLDSIKENVIKVIEEIGLIINWQPTSSVPNPSSASPPATTKTTTMVGFDVYVEQLLDELKGYHPGRQIIPIVGMGGIGKTTLAKNVYKSLESAPHFDVCAWATVSQAFNARDILSQALSCLGRSTSTTVNYDQLGEELSKTLFGRRYLVILDDVWSVEAWEKIMRFFPDNSNGSRIVITTRQQELVEYFGSSAIAVDFLDDKECWELFCESTFGQKGCPHPELEQVGKKIVRKCGGLPLALILLGGILGKWRTQEYWENIANDRSLVMDSEEGKETSSILNLSYKHLPVRLKSCFLYLRLFPEDDTINVPQLIKLWVAEGFIKSKADQSLEETAESYIMELVDRNLVIVRSLRENKKLNTCSLHDLVRDLSIRIAGKENFNRFKRDIDGKHLFIFDENTAAMFNHNIRSSGTPSIFTPLRLSTRVPVPMKIRLLRVSFFDLGREADSFQQVNLRFLLYDFPDGTCSYELPSSMSLLWCLQTINIGSVMTVAAPSEIWEMPQLRHINIWSLCLPQPPCSIGQDDVIVLQNLQTLKRVEKNLILSDEVCKRIPNIKELEIRYEFNEQGEASSCYYLHNVGCFDKLELLRFYCGGYEYAGDSMQNLKFPSSLKELSLEGCNLEWSDVAMIASLPHLEILDLLEDAVVGDEWDCSELEFRCLKRLHIDRCRDLVNWIAADNCSNFPVLESLSLWFLPKLEEIPSSIGEIATLETMVLQDCSESATMSAVMILEAQDCSGNEALQLNLWFWVESDAGIWKEKTQRFTSLNLQITGYLEMPTDDEILRIAEDIAEIEGP